MSARRLLAVFSLLGRFVDENDGEDQKYIRLEFNYLF